MRAMMSHEEIAQVMGISKGRVRQLEQSVLKKLKKRLSRLAPGSDGRQFVAGEKQNN